MESNSKHLISPTPPFKKSAMYRPFILLLHISLKLLFTEPSVSLCSSDRQSIYGDDKGDEDRKLGGLFERCGDAGGWHGVWGGLCTSWVLMVGLIGGLLLLLGCCW